MLNSALFLKGLLKDPHLIWAPQYLRGPSFSRLYINPFLDGAFTKEGETCKKTRVNNYGGDPGVYIWVLTYRKYTFKKISPQLILVINPL